MEATLREVSEKVIKMCGYILRKFLHWTLTALDMKNDVVRRLLHRS